MHFGHVFIFSRREEELNGFFCFLFLLYHFYSIGKVHFDSNLYSRQAHIAPMPGVRPMQRHQAKHSIKKSIEQGVTEVLSCITTRKKRRHPKDCREFRELYWKRKQKKQNYFTESSDRKKYVTVIFILCRLYPF